MNFKGHAVGGLLTATAVGAAAYSFSPDPILSERSSELVRQAYRLSFGLPIRVDIFILTLFMSLFPDLDTSSISQRWFFRVCFVVLGVLFYYRIMDLFAIVAFTALLPVLHKHRGWTHWKVTPWVLAVSFMVVLEYFRSKNSWYSGFSWNNVWSAMVVNLHYVLACVAGHYTHLALDSKWIGHIPFCSNSMDHH